MSNFVCASLTKCSLHNLLAKCLEQPWLKDLNIVKMQEIITYRMRSNSVAPKHNQNIKKFSAKSFWIEFETCK